MNYKIKRTNRFNNEVEKLSEEEISRIENIINQLKDNPYVGDQLQIRILREKRLMDKRVYYLVFDDLQVILMVAIGNKKIQQRTIDFVIQNIENYKESLKGLIDD